MAKFKPVSAAMKFFIWIIRGTPLLLQGLLVLYIPPVIFNIENKNLYSMLNLSRAENLYFFFALFAFTINYACYFAVIIEGGIKNVPTGQYEAGKVLGMTKGQIFRKVVLMQVIKRILPPMSNEIITLVKDTALSRVIGIIEIIKVADLYASKAILWPLFYAGVFYLLFVGILTLLFNYTEKKLSYYKV